jgi:hypothetical protein
MIEAENNSTTESVCIGILNWSQSFDSLPSFSQNIPGIIGAAVVNDNDFMGNVVKAEFDVKMLDRRGDAFGFSRARELRHSEVEAVAVGQEDWSRWRGKIQPVRVAFGVVGNFIENGWKIALGSPIKLSGSLCVIHHQPWNIESAWRRIRLDRMLSETLRAPISELG